MMHSRPSAAILVLVALAAAPAGAAERIRLVERATGEKVVPLTQAPDALGDLLVFSNPLLDAANVVAVGTSRGYCVRVELGKWWQCQWTMQLAAGALQVAGPYPDDGDAQFTIVGGTGRYAGSRGTLKVHARNAAHSSYDFLVELL
jgi:hypothetical protein